MKPLIHPLSWLLLPFAGIYGLLICIRNLLYDWGVLHSTAFDIPVICVGNITVGGTGKTPHTEYLVEMLSARYRIAILSRGYKRSTRGFQLVDPGSLASEMGDEPLQIKCKFPQVMVAVHAHRVEGIRKIRTIDPGIQLVILDDGFQHRRLRPSLSILLVDSLRPLYNDFLLPVGRLREFSAGKKRAQLLVFTKCPAGMSIEEQKKMQQRIKPAPTQTVLFSSLAYGNLKPFRSAQDIEINLEKQITAHTHILLLTGIANPTSLINFLSPLAGAVKLLSFPDHHSYNEADILNIQLCFEALQAQHKIVVTTEKDAVRLAGLALPADLEQHIYVLPVKVSFHDGGRNPFTTLILEHVSRFT